MRWAIVVGLMLVGCGGSDESDAFMCGPTDAELYVRSGVAGLPVSGPRHVKIVLDSGMSPEMQFEWTEAVEDWRAAVEKVCPFVPEYVIAPTSSDLSFDGTSRNAPPKDTIELRVDAVQPEDKQGNGWPFPVCRSGRATMLPDAPDVHRTTRHELGHALGNLWHDTSGKPSIMAVEGTDWWRVSDIQPEDVERYATNWCPAR